MKQEDYQDRVDTFRNTLLTQAKRISKLYDDFEINTVAHVFTLKNKNILVGVELLQFRWYC